MSILAEMLAEFCPNGVELKKEIFILDTDGEISLETFINRNS